MIAQLFESSGHIITVAGVLAADEKPAPVSWGEWFLVFAGVTGAVATFFAWLNRKYRESVKVQVAAVIDSSVKTAVDEAVENIKKEIVSATSPIQSTIQSTDNTDKILRTLEELRISIDEIRLYAAMIDMRQQEMRRSQVSWVREFDRRMSDAREERAQILKHYAEQAALWVEALRSQGIEVPDQDPFELDGEL